MPGQVRKKRLYLLLGLVCKRLADLENLGNDAGLSLGEFMYRERMLEKYYQFQSDLASMEKVDELMLLGLPEELLLQA